jgi:rod shape-determining protein MreC
MGKWQKLVPWLLFFVALALSGVLLVQTYGRQRESQMLPEKVAASIGQGTTEGFSAVTSAVKDFFTWLIHWRELANENQQAQMEIAQLTTERDLLTQQVAEYEQIQAILGYQQTLTDMKTVYAKVIAKEPGSWIDQFTINKGSADGIAKDMVVVNDQGLVGRVTEAAEHQATVVTIVDPRSSISIMLERSRDEGIFKGAQDTTQSAPLCSLEYLPFNADMVPGDRVVTSNLGGVFPKGILVGTVVESASAKNSGQYAVVEPAVDFGHISHVLVLTDLKEEQ